MTTTRDRIEYFFPAKLCCYPSKTCRWFQAPQRVQISRNVACLTFTQKLTFYVAPVELPFANQLPILMAVAAQLN